MPPAPSILQALSPRICVFESPEVTASLESNSLKGLDQLFRPFEGAVERVSILSSLLTPTVHPTYALRFISHETLMATHRGGGGAVPYSPEVVVDVVSNLVGKLRPEDESHYDVFRDVLLASRPITEHETFNHPVCFVLATSSSSPDPIAALANLQMKSQGSPFYASRPYMDGTVGGILRFWAVVHDVAKEGPNLDRAQQILAQVKKQFGPHASLLIINSAPPMSVSSSAPDGSILPSSPPPFSEVYNVALANLALNDPFMNLPALLSGTTSVINSVSTEYVTAPSSLIISHSRASTVTGSMSTDMSDETVGPSERTFAQLLAPQDIASIKGFLRELTTQSLVPWMEGRVREWNEVFNNSRRGITGRLFGAGRKFFGGGAAKPAASASGYNTVRGYYLPSTPEAISRRLGDFAFMLRDYKLAGSVYDSIRRDYVQDGAIKLGGSATEMYGLATLMSLAPLGRSVGGIRLQQQQQTLVEIESWLEQAVLAYSSGRSALQLDGLRATVLYYEAWKAFGAAENSWEWAGVSSSLVKGAGDADEVPSAILLEQAADVDMKSRKPRKRRRAAHLVMSARRYEKSGHKAFSRRCLERALGYYREQNPPWGYTQNYIEYALGRQAYTLGESSLAVEHFLILLRQGVGSDGQAGVLEDFVLAYQQLQDKPEMYKKALPQLALPSPMFDVTKTSIVIPAEDDDCGMERDRWEQLEERALRPASWSGSTPPRSTLRPVDRNIVGVKETFLVRLAARNPLDAELQISQLRLSVVDTYGNPATDVVIEDLEPITLLPLEVREISVGVTIHSQGRFRVTAATFLFHSMLLVTQSLDQKGARLFATKQDRLEPAYASNDSLVLDVVSPRPRLTLSLEGFPNTLAHGVIRRITFNIRNAGVMPIVAIQVSCNLPGTFDLQTSDGSESADGVTIPNRIEPQPPSVISLPNDVLAPGATMVITMTMCASLLGVHEAMFLFVYKDASSPEGDYASTRAAHLFQVKPLLSASVSFSGVSGDASTVGAEVKIFNNSEATDVVIIGCSLVSRSWSTAGSSKSRSLHRLSPGQSASCFGLLSLTAKDGEHGAFDETFTASKLLSVLQGQKPPATYPEGASLQVSPFFHGDQEVGPAPRLPLINLLRQAFATASVAERYPTITADDIPHIFPLFPALDLDLWIHWSILSKVDESVAMRGCNIIHGLRPAPEQSVLDSVQAVILGGSGKAVRSMYEETNRMKRVMLESILDGPLSREENPLRVRMVAAGAVRGRVRHDFSQGPHILSVAAEIVNASPRFPAKITLSLSPPLSKYSQAGQARYIGAQRVTKTLQPSSTCTIPLRLCIREPSFLDLRSWLLEVEVGRSEGDVWTPRATFVMSGLKEGGGYVEVVQDDEGGSKADV